MFLEKTLLFQYIFILFFDKEHVKATLTSVVMHVLRMTEKVTGN